MRGWVLAGVVTSVACGDGAGADSADLVHGTSSPTDAGFPSSFASAKLRLTSLVLQPLDTGGDVDGDGTPDNRLPRLIDRAGELAGPDSGLSLAEVNAEIASGLSTGSAAVLLDARHEDLDLAVDLLWGSWNPFTDGVSVDSTSYKDGEPRAAFVGQFHSETSFLAVSDAIDLPVVLTDGAPPSFVPYVDARLEGDLDAAASDGLIFGAIPVDRLVAQVFEPLIPLEGVDVDGDGQIGADETHAAVLDTVREVLSDPSIADVLLDDGSRAVSGSFAYRAVPADF